MTADKAKNCDPLAAQEGSAYIITLMVLFILTVIGMSLTLITQTEMLVGSQDRITQRVFYTADAGLQVAIARALRFNTDAIDYELRQAATIMPGRTLTMADQVELSAFVPLWEAACLGCEVNQGEEEFRRISHAVTSVATRVGKDLVGTDDVPVARKQITAMVEFLPWDLRQVSFVLPDAELAKVIF